MSFLAKALCILPNPVSITLILISFLTETVLHLYEIMYWIVGQCQGHDLNCIVTVSPDLMVLTIKFPKTNSVAR